MMFHSLLAWQQALTDNFKYIALGAAILIGVIAFICGAVKGFYRTSRRWIKIAAVLVGFFALCLIPEAKHPLAKINLFKSLGADILSAILVGANLLASIAVLNGVFGIIDAIVKSVAIKKLEKSVEVSKKADPRERLKEQREIDKKWKPNAFSRICAGFACMLNVGVIISIVLGFAIFVCAFIPFLSLDKLAFVYQSIPEKLWDLLHTYALDTFALLFILSVSYCGYRAGILNGIRAIFSTFGNFAVALVGFVLPLSPTVSALPIFTPISFLADWFTSLLSSIVPKYAALLGNLAAGAVLSLILTLAFVFLGKFLKFITRNVRRVAVVRVIDGSICFVLTFALAVAAVCAAAAILFTLNTAGAFGETFRFTNLFTDQTPLQNVFKQLFDTRLLPFMSNLSNVLPR